ncbi:MAG: hypothetical protein HRU36_02525 [Rickettsiales bacterium]|nr:hypothetical protein [Rickettsiales bacterium]
MEYREIFFDFCACVCGSVAYNIMIMNHPSAIVLGCRMGIVVSELFILPYTQSGLKDNNQDCNNEDCNHSFCSDTGKVCLSGQDSDLSNEDSNYY